MKTRNVITVAAVMGIGALGMAGSAQATGNPDLTSLTAATTLTIDEYCVATFVGSNSISLTPNVQAIQDDVIETTPLTINIATNSDNGYTLSVKAGTGGTDAINPEHIELKANAGSYVELPAADAESGATLLTTSDENIDGSPVTIGIKVSNLSGYVAKSGSTEYTRNIVFTAVAN